MRFRLDVTIDAPRALDIGGTRFQLIPVAGGETEDALSSMRERGVLVAGTPIFSCPSGRARLGPSVARARSEQLVPEADGRVSGVQSVELIVNSSRQARAAEALYATER